PEVDMYDWITVVGDHERLRSYDRYGLRALLSMIRHTAGLQTLLLTVDDNTLMIQTTGTRELNSTARELLTEIAVWGDFELVFGASEAMLRERKKDDA
ncbi:MAG TPA: hypothetical protein VHG93_00600, partial [Longimicrobium sp.]|nr:hypothetical protein [Longimicrobium sp.]